jgi:penicillin-binding protein 1C
MLTLKISLQNFLRYVFSSCYGAAAYILLPKPELLNYQGYSTAIFDRNEQLLRIALALDDRYRLYIPISSTAEHFQQVTILYEAQDFYQHSGVDYGALIRTF